MEIMIVTILAALAFSPLLVAYRRHQKGKNPKGAMALNIVSVFALCLLTTGMGIVERVFFNDRLPGIHLIKVDSADLYKPIANARFRFEAVDGSFGPVEYTTLEDGTIDLSKLPADTAYVVTELECPGYVIDDEQRIIHLDRNEQAQFVFTNSRLPSLYLYKTSTDNSPLTGVTYRLAKIEDGSR